MIPSKTEIIVAHQQIRPFIVNTPILSSDNINSNFGAKIYFKCENFQKIGAFKARGGFNAALNLSKQELTKGICTHSSGNHAQAIALAAKNLGVKAYIVMPHNAPKAKIDGVRSLGSEIIFCDPTPEARQQGVDEIIKNKGAFFIHPFDNYRVIAGQATVAKELFENHSDLEAIFAPVGGGGLLSGTGLSAKYFSPKTKVFGGEPEGAADAVYSIKSGKVEKAKFINTIADGLKTHLSEKTLEIIKNTVTDITLVSESEIKAALKILIENLKIIVEPSSAVAFAAFIKTHLQFKNQKIGIILTGGNIDFSILREL